ncbi:EAL domain-containing response regulator [Vibrio sp. 10N.286.51.B11]|jgi:EAL domain-containing protein (putative c-di-GMP-specific phosphodiesterase class I)|uniref:EAL domain-containing response regulator n=1 Tax=unclassified Vibrio TaxID=2614977 RepID=UPI0010BDAE81|nr:EAL domain-containing response regulator [Vibrio sp. F13]TKF98672.1 EAL domain-containing response regulator [Vibrio sp. F13]
MKILLLDDNPLETEIIKSKLNQYDFYEILCFNHASLAYEYLRHNFVDLVIIDLDMPEEDGLLVLSKLSAINFEQPLCILSGLGEDIIILAEKVARLYGLNIICSNVKPINDIALKKVVECAAKLKSKVDSNDFVSNISSYSLKEIMSGIERDELIVHYQPQYSFNSKELVSFEALIRWDHSSDGLLYPKSFMPMLEKSGNTRVIFNALFNMVTSKIAKYPSELKFSINISSKDLSDETFVGYILDILDSKKLSPDRFTFEITENIAYELEPIMLQNITRLKINGFGLSIDDFGIGHSNLINLVEIPFTELKIDRRFVKNYLLCLKHKHALELSVSLAKKLGLIVVAEGIEVYEEYSAMKNLGVDICQGYLTGKPDFIENILNFREHCYTKTTFSIDKVR